MSFQRRHYVFLADWLAGMRANRTQLDLAGITHDLADALAKDNPAFKRDVFLKAAGCSLLAGDCVGFKARGVRS